MDQSVTPDRSRLLKRNLPCADENEAGYAPACHAAVHCEKALKRFQAKWRPVRVKKTRQINNLEPRFDSIETEKALA